LAFRQAVRAGADRIELDVHGSADSQLIVYHGYTLTHPAHPDALICQTAADVILAFKGGEGEPVPFLDDVFAEFGTQIDYEVELKGFTDEFLSTVLAAVKHHGLLPRIEFTSPHLLLLAHLRAREPAAQIGLFVTPFPRWMSEGLGVVLLLGDLTLGRFNVAHCPVTMLNQALVATLHAHHYRVHAADCNTEGELAQAFTLGVDQLSTDDVALARVIRERVQGRA
jgi:glycerophosphoryl diester phosphodiesterase